MKERMEKLVVLPFSMGCVSNSSVAVGEGDCSSAVKLKNPVGFFPIPRSNISAGLMKLIKSLSHLFVYKEEGREEMEIGFPTDVKHVTHIGWDGSTTTTMNIKGQDSFETPELLSLSSISLGQFELAMAAQADATLADGPPPVRLDGDDDDDVGVCEIV